MKIKLLLSILLFLAASACKEDFDEVVIPESKEVKTLYTLEEAIELGMPIADYDYFTNPIAESSDTIITINSTDEEILLKFNSMASLISCWIDINDISYPCGEYHVAKCSDNNYWIFHPYETTGIPHITISQKDPYSATIKTNNIGDSNIHYTITFGRSYGLLFFDPRGFPKYCVTIKK